jgi:2-oxoisovalerate dehydrogenase E1 component alpha subunit
LRLHVPEPEVRPGGTPDFSSVKIAPAGSVRRPEVDASPEDIRDLAYSIIRVLNREGEAVGPWAGLLSDDELAEGLRHMMTLRTFDARMLMAQRQGKTSFYMQPMGEEAVSCASSARRYEFPDLSPGGPAHRRRLSDGRHDEPDLLE